MANPCVAEDLAVRWRPLSTQETLFGWTLINDAWRMLKRRLVDLETEIAADADLKAEAVRVIATAVLRVMKNPDGEKKFEIDDYSAERHETAASGLLYFTDDEIDSLVSDGSDRSGAFSFDLLGANYPDARFPDDE